MTFFQKIKMADSLVICAKNVVFPHGESECKEGPFHVAVERGLITAIDKCTGKCRECETCEFLTPGFVDIHNHGMVQVSPSGRTLSIVGTNTLAGSCNTLLETFHSLVNIFGVPIGKAVAMLSENPATFNPVLKSPLYTVKPPLMDTSQLPRSHILDSQK